MGKILIANIGYRSLIYKNHDNKFIGEETYDLGDGKTLIQESFLKTTEKILNEKLFDYVQLNILNTLLIEKHRELDRIYLFVSNQSGVKNSSHTHNDTLHAGEIIKHLIAVENAYQITHEAINIIEIDKAVNKADGLLTTYRIYINEILESNPNSILMFCDSGGTPQQKSSMKIVAEYLLEESQYEYFQVVEQTENGIIDPQKSTLEKLHRVEYRKIVNEENILLLISKGNYDAAWNIRKSDFSVKSDTSLRALDFYRKRILLMTDDAKKIIHNSTRIFRRNHPEVQNYFASHDAFYNSNWQTIFPNIEEYWTAWEALTVSDYYRRLGKLSNWVLSTQVFLEKLTTNYLKNHHFQGYGSQIKSRKWVPNNLSQQGILNLLEKDSISQKLRFLKKSNHQGNLQNIHSTFLYNLIVDFISLHSSVNNSKPKTGLDKLRNQIAHSGKGVTINNIKNEIPNLETMFKNWLTFFNMDVNQKNIYEIANDHIAKTLRTDS